VTDEASGNLYYWNPDTEEVSWTLPPGVTVTYPMEVGGSGGAEEAAAPPQEEASEVAAPPVVEDMPPGLECEEEAALLVRRVEKELQEGVDQLAQVSELVVNGEAALGQPLILTESLVPAQDFLKLVKEALDQIDVELKVRKFDWEQGGLLVQYFRDRLAEVLENLKYYRAEVEKTKLDVIFLTDEKPEEPGTEVVVEKPARKLVAEPVALPEEAPVAKKRGPERVVTSSSARQMKPLVEKWKKVGEVLEQDEKREEDPAQQEQLRLERWRLRQLQKGTASGNPNFCPVAPRSSKVRDQV